MSLGIDGDAVFVAEHVLEQDLERVRQPLGARQESRRKISNVRPPTARSARAPKLLWLVLWLLVAIASLLGSAWGASLAHRGPGVKRRPVAGLGPAASEDPGLGPRAGP